MKYFCAHDNEEDLRILYLAAAKKNLEKVIGTKNKKINPNAELEKLINHIVEFFDATSDDNPLQKKSTPIDIDPLINFSNFTKKQFIRIKYTKHDVEEIKKLRFLFAVIDSDDSFTEYYLISVIKKKKKNYSNEVKKSFEQRVKQL